MLQVSGPGGGTWQPAKAGGVGIHTISPRGLGDGWHAWLYAVGMNGGTPSPWSSFPTASPGSPNIVWEGFGIDRASPIVVATNHTPPSPFSTQTVNLSARARDQAALSGLRWIQIRISTNGGVTYGAPIQSPNYNGAFDRTFTTTRGPWAAGTNVCFQARARDRAGNQSGWGGRDCFLVRAGADLAVDPIGNYGEFHVNDPFSVNVIVRNTGEQNAGAFVLQFCPRGNRITYTCSVAWQSRNIASLAAGSALLRTFNITAPNSAGFPRTYYMLARADWPPPGAVQEEEESANNRNWGQFTVIGPPPWFMTRIGDVGSYEKIEPKIPPPVGRSADYLVISESVITRFTSVRDWLVPNYTGINIKPAPVDLPPPAGTSIYQAYFDKYKPDTTNTIANLNAISASGGNRVYYVNGTLSIPGGGVVFNKEPAVVFVREHMEINGSLVIGSNTGIIFVVNEYIEVKNGVGRADGVYLFDGDFTVRSRGNSTERRFFAYGSVIGGFDRGTFELNRDFRSALNGSTPTERFIYQAKYLWLFREVIGDTKARFKEVAP
jgi:hypothetical protein